MLIHVTLNVCSPQVCNVFIKAEKIDFGIIILYMQDRKSAVRTVFIKVEKYTFWYDYTLYASPQVRSPHCVYQG